jgi:chemotaxis protein methyltransferase CheR
MSREKIKLTEEEIKLFQEYIKERSGINIQEGNIYTLEDAINERLKKTKIENVRDYYNFLKFHPLGREDEFREFLNFITIRETHFFRNPPHFKALENKILPELKNRRAIRIWSAGCSTGEEPYSIAISVIENILDYREKKIEIFASDISEYALKVAKEGVYEKRSVKYIDERILKKYFIQKDTKYYLKEEVKKLVKFFYHNLITDVYPSLLDVIFCRNVTIYFDKETTRKVIAKFYLNLKDGGYLIIGHSESLYGINSQFELVDVGDAFIYRKTEKKLPAEKKIFEFPKKNIFEKEKKQFQEVEAQEGILTQFLSDELEVLIDEAYLLYQKKKYTEAIEICTSICEKFPHFYSAYYLSGLIYADRGWYEEAKKALEKAIRIDPFATEAYFLLGLIYNKMENKKEAEKNFKKAIYLDNNFALAHFTLAELYAEEEKISSAIREYENTIETLEFFPFYLWEEFTGWNKEIIKTTCNLKITLLKGKNE